ncbi:hypothetical protein BGZ52_009612 [Haplosporangium bisporale]|nr:hypothetical protein BGZ52_009612 [Haplosporangium bisporale]KAF9217797.1 hypothetical protein BGZ59_010533 [Podila verticillata]KFH63960.1 hypothetical protein MVEG_09785 [Podila verticillata NRRL 6337]
MFRSVAKTGLGLLQRQQPHALASAFHTTAGARSQLPDIFASLRNNSSSSSSSSSSTSSSNNNLFSSRNSNTPRSDFSLFGFSSAPKANTTANPIHLDTNHPTEGRSFRVNSPATVDQAYRRLRSALNQSNMKRELRLRRTYETGHVRMRRENQERNKKLFGAMVRKKIELIKLMKIRGM